MRAPALVGWWLVLLLSAAILEATSDSPLVEAVKNGDQAAVRTLLRRGADVNTPYGDGTTALHWAAYRNDLEIADLLIRAGANVNAANDLGATPVWVACSNATAAMVERLLTAGADPNAALPSGETPLMTASRANNVEAVKLLLSRGANVNARESVHGQTALMWAAAQQHAQVVQTLAEFGADVHARSKVWPEVVNVGGNGNVTLTTDSSANPPDPVKMDQGSFTPLLFAARQGDIESARHLLVAGANVNDASAVGASALVVAAHSGHGGFAAFLLDKGADPNAAGAGYTPLHAAVLRGDLELVKALLAHGANPNAPVTKPTPVRRSSQDFALTNPVVGATPFWLAATFLNPNIMRVLAANGADPLFSKGGMTVLIAVMQGYRGEGSRGGARESPAAQERDTLEAVKLVLDLGVEVDAPNEAGDTALHTAAAKGFDTVVQLLVEKGAKLEAKNKKGQTPLAMTAPATEGRDTGGNSGDTSAGGRKSTADLLRKLGAKE